MRKAHGLCRSPSTRRGVVRRSDFRPARRRSDPVPGRKPGELKRVSTRGDMNRTHHALTSARACHYPRARSLAKMCCPLSAKRPERPLMLPMANATADCKSPAGTDGSAFFEQDARKEGLIFGTQWELCELPWRREQGVKSSPFPFF